MKKNNFQYRLYGRSKGRKKNNIINSQHIKFQINKLNPSEYNVIDIGSGYGESTIEFAKHYKNQKIIACDNYIDGINNIIKLSKINSLENIYIYYGNVHQLLDECCLPNSISEIWILFPDPWPKKRHFKRRLIGDFFLNKIKILLKKNASIHIASDSRSYISQILCNVHKVKNDFLWVNQSNLEWNYSNLSLPKTKYYKKALENGSNPMYLKLIKL